MAPAPSRTVRLCLLGFGHVARAFCALLERQEQTLADRHGLRLLVSAVGTRHGSLVEPRGLRAAELQDRASAGLPAAALPARELMIASEADLLVELTVLEGDFAPLATAHIETAFELGLDVVTANKGPIAWNWPRIAERARVTGRRIRCEGAVMDGLPVFSLLELALPDCRLLGFEAVFNSTSNAIMDALGEGRGFAAALAEAQAAGYAEADPTHDIDGWDAASKAAALANVAMDAGITPADIQRQSLRDLAPERFLEARAQGRRLRMVTTVWREADETVCGRIQAAELAPDHPLAPVGGTSLGAILHTDLMGDVVVAELGALLPQTAYALYSDVLMLYASHRGAR